jgi:hypothetical protein
LPDGSHAALYPSFAKEPQGEVERLPGKKFIFDAKAAAS